MASASREARILRCMAAHPVTRVGAALLLSALLFWPAPTLAGASNRPPPTASCPPGHGHMVRAWLGAATPEAARIKESVRAEIAGVWLRAGVHLRWLDTGPGPGDATAVRIIIQDQEVRGAAAGRIPVLAWIMFAGGKPLPLIRASTRHARLVLARSREARMTRGRGLNVEAFRTLMARAIGWAIAHEIGHYISGSAQHDAEGLMRPHFDAREFERPNPAATTLSVTTIRRLQAQLDTCVRVAP